MRNINRYLLVFISIFALSFHSIFAENDEGLTKELDFCKYPEMYPGINLHLGYWDGFRGRGNLIRHVFELSQLPYIGHAFGGYNSEGAFDFSNWFAGHKPLLSQIDPSCSPNLPFLVDCTNTRTTKFMTETLDLMIYLARKYNPKLLGEGLAIPENQIISAAVTANNLFSGWIQYLIGKEGSIEAVLNSPDFFTDGDVTGGPIITVFQVEEFVKSQVQQYDGPLTFGNDVTIPDIFVYEFANLINTLFPGIINEHPSIRGLVDAFNEIPLVTRFIHSERSVIYPPLTIELLPFQYSMAFNPRRSFSAEIPRLGQYLVFYGHSESTSAASICLAHKIFSMSSSSIDSEEFNEMYGLLQFPQIVDVATRMIGRNALVRTWYRVFRRLGSTKNKMKRSCVAILTSGKYHQVSISNEQAQEICSSFVNCYTNRSTAWNATKTLIDASNRFSFFGGSTSVFNSERYFKKYITAPLLFAKAIRFYYTSKAMLKNGSFSKKSIVEILNETQKQGAVSTFGFTVNKELAIKICIDYCSDKLPNKSLYSFKSSYSMQALCETSFMSYYPNESSELAVDKASTLVSLLDQISN
ncbi:glutathione S-transferase Mu 1 isoform X1 [Cryptosporidium sp. chipmunk genotype I]|uniref:glutathione S-transferase Mu 1 isoform X1 n=1 Tax=Cryptosporidium sp. chipmunk genotype I TaxID=1280935 RepID=UPI003519E784|nr:glutathione S-transferase Mu 1 isoform X1 [Cryptosporidium sp. chipmunk genotype I]